MNASSVTQPDMRASLWPVLSLIDAIGRVRILSGVVVDECVFGAMPSVDAADTLTPNDLYWLTRQLAHYARQLLLVGVRRCACGEFYAEARGRCLYCDLWQMFRSVTGSSWPSRWAAGMGVAI